MIQMIMKYHLKPSEEDKQKPLKEDVKNGDFVLAKYSSKRAISHFIDEVLQALNEDDILEVKFLVRQSTKMKGVLFVIPEKEDIDETDFEDIILKLPKPIRLVAAQINVMVLPPNYGTECALKLIVLNVGL